MSSEAESLPLAAPAAHATAGEARNPFRVRGYVIWLIASVLAGTGVGIQAVTVPLFVRDRVSDDHRALAIAAVLVCQNAPAALFALVGGVVADRVERRRILVRTYGVAALVSVGYVVLSSSETRWIWPAFVLSAIVGSAGAFTNPARQSMVPQIVSRAMIQNAAIFGTMAFMATLQFAGPALGGVLVDGPGLSFAFGTEVGLLAAAAMLFARIATDRPIPTGRTVFRDLADGIRYIRGQPTILSMIALGTLPETLLMGPLTANLPIFVPDELHRSDKFIGLLFGSMGLGIVLGSVVLASYRFPRRGPLVLLSIVFGGGMIALFSLSPSVWVAMPAMVIMGATGPAIFINFVVALIQEHTDPRLMGRVMSVYGLSFTSSLPIGFGQAALTSTLFGPRVSLMISGLVCFAIGVACFSLMRGVRRLS